MTGGLLICPVFVNCRSRYVKPTLRILGSKLSTQAASVSRLMADVVSPEHQQWARRIVGHLAAHRRAETLINIGAYSAGSNADIDAAIQMIGHVNAFLQQGMDEKAAFAKSLEQLSALALAPIEATSEARMPVPVSRPAAQQ